jgi:hypothetical protein
MDEDVEQVAEFAISLRPFLDAGIVGDIHLKKMYVAIKAAGRFLTGCGIPRRKEYSMPFREKLANDLEANTFIGARY